MDRCTRGLLSGVMVGCLLTGCFQPVGERQDAGPLVVDSPGPRTCGVPGKGITYYPWRPELYGCTIFAGHLDVTVPVGTFDLAAPRGVRAIEGILAIMNNLSMRNLQGLEDLERAGELVLVGNNELTDLRALSSLTSVNEISVLTNPKLESLDGLSGLRTIQSLVIDGNDSFRSLAGLSSLELIRGDLELLGNKSLSGSEISTFLARVRVDGNVSIR